MIRYSILLTSIFAVFAMLTVFYSINTIQYRLYKRNIQFYPCNDLESNATMIDNALILPNPLSSTGNARIIVPVGDANIANGDRIIVEIKHLNNTLIFQNGTDICNDTKCLTKEDIIDFTTSISELSCESSEYYM
ncbi:14237_t:CDS:1, partial [Cetraspora pellucida]